MNEDNQILLFSFVFYWVTLLVCSIKSKNWKKTFFVNLIIHIIYSSYFLYGLIYDVGDGSALAWYLLLLFIIAIHWIANLIILIVGLLQKNQP